jgi:hypothetical protein
MRARMTATIAAGATALLLVGCSSSAKSGGDANNASTLPPSTTTTTTEAATSAAATTSAAAAPGKPISVGKSFSDPVMGDKGTVLTYLRNFPVSAAAKAKYSALEDEEVVLVQVKVTASSKYYDTLGAGSFYLVGTDGIDDASTTILDDEVKKAGYPTVPDAETGKTTTGWVVFTPDKGAAHLTLRYKRLAAKPLGGGKEIPAKNFDIALG